MTPTILLAFSLLMGQIDAPKAHLEPTVKKLSKGITILGEVKRPGIYPTRLLPLRIFDAVAMVGGFSDPATAYKTSIVVIRGDRKIRFNWNQFRDGKDLEQNIFLRDGDEVRVTRPKT